jgi:hypothetical protein
MPKSTSRLSSATPNRSGGYNDVGGTWPMLGSGEPGGFWFWTLNRE